MLKTQPLQQRSPLAIAKIASPNRPTASVCEQIGAPRMALTQSYLQPSRNRRNARTRQRDRSISICRLRFADDQSSRDLCQLLGNLESSFTQVHVFRAQSEKLPLTQPNSQRQSVGRVKPIVRGFFQNRFGFVNRKRLDVFSSRHGTASATRIGKNHPQFNSRSHCRTENRNRVFHRSSADVSISHGGDPFADIQRCQFGQESFPQERLDVILHSRLVAGQRAGRFRVLNGGMKPRFEELPNSNPRRCRGRSATLLTKFIQQEPGMLSALTNSGDPPPLARQVSHTQDCEPLTVGRAAADRSIPVTSSFRHLANSQNSHRSGPRLCHPTSCAESFLSGTFRETSQALLEATLPIQYLTPILLGDLRFVLTQRAFLLQSRVCGVKVLAMGMPLAQRVDFPVEALISTGFSFALSELSESGAYVQTVQRVGVPARREWRNIHVCTRRSCPC